MKKIAALPRQAMGFTLLETLVVMGILALLMAFALPSIGGIMKGSQITQAADLVVGQLKYASQMALSQNRPIEVRFYKFSDPASPSSSNAIRAIQFWVLNPDSTRTPTGKPQRFPSAIIISDNSALTTLGSELQSSALGNAEKVAALPPGYTYYTFQFRPDGSTSFDPSAPNQWFFTVLGENRPGTPPANYATVQIEPVTGNIRVYRP